MTVQCQRDACNNDMLQPKFNARIQHEARVQRRTAWSKIDLGIVSQTIYETC